MRSRPKPLRDKASRHWPHRARTALRRSLRLRLLIVFLLMALAMTTVFLAGTQRGLGQAWRAAVQPVVADYMDRLVAEIGSPPSVERAKALVARLPISIRIDGPQVQWSSHPEQDGFRSRRRDEAERWLERSTADGHRVVFGVGDVPWERGPHRAVWLTLTLLLAMAAVAYVYLHRLLRPLNDIRAGAQRFGKGDFATPIVVRRRDELGELATQVNTMAHDIHGMLEGKRALLLAISHELRSPLTRARVNAELLPETQDVAAPREALLRDLAQMRDMITDLLEGERLSGAHVALQRERTDVVRLVHGLMDSRADFAVVALHMPDAPLWADVDAARLRLAVRNLVDNALRHGAGQGPAPVLTVRSDGGDLEVCVRDHGPGVDEAQLSLLAQAFYRPDAARQRSTGGVGLGLYLARLVAEAHGGALHLRTAHPGLEARLRWPLG